MALILSKKDPLATSERWEEFDSSTRIKLRGIDNPQYQVAVGRMRRIVDGFDAKAAGEPIAMDGERSFYQLQATALARYVLLDWDGVLDEEGEKGPYSAEAAEQLLTANVEFHVGCQERDRDRRRASQEEGRDRGKATARWEWEREWRNALGKRRLIYARLGVEVPDEPPQDEITRHVLDMYAGVCRGRRYLPSVGGPPLPCQ